MTTHLLLHQSRTQNIRTALRMFQQTLTLDSEQKMHQFGLLLAKRLPQQLTIAFIGELGAGKTTLVRAIVQGLKVPEEAISSPTFVLIQEYFGTRNIAHCDVYRLRAAEDLLDLGIDEYFDGNWICLIEWANRVSELLPEDHLRINIRAIGENRREVQLNSTGKISESLILQPFEQLFADDVADNPTCEH